MKIYGELAKLDAKSCSCVQTVIWNLNITGNAHNKRRRGHPRKLNESDVCVTRKRVQTSPRLSAPDISKNLAAETGKTVHPETVEEF